MELPFTNIQDISSGSSYTLLLIDSKVYIAGFGILGLGKDVSESFKLSKIDLDKPIKKIYAGLNYSAAITHDNELWTWGFNLNGRIGICPEKYPMQWIPRKVSCYKLNQKKLI